MLQGHHPINPEAKLKELVEQQVIQDAKEAPASEARKGAWTVGLLIVGLVVGLLTLMVVTFR
jgi:hypothetical protein